MARKDIRMAAEILAELLGDQHVHLVVREPERDLCDLRRELLDLDAIKLVHIHLDELKDVEMMLFGLPCCAENCEFKLPQFPIGYDKEVAAAACRVKEF